MSNVSNSCRSSKKLNYVPSSWNYGSFHPNNPYYNRKKQTKENPNKTAEVKRSSSANLNRFGKRILKEEEKIVTEDYLKTMNELKIIKNINNSNKIINHHNSHTSDMSKDSENEGSLLKVMNSSKKSFKYQLSYEEWVAVKAKEQEIYNNVKVIKDKEDQNFEQFNSKINENYDLVKEQAYKEWLEKKENEKLQQLQVKKQLEEQKNFEKMKKQQMNEESIENWIKRQAEAMEIQNRIKRMKEEIMRQELIEKQKREEVRKIQAEDAFRTWAKRKASEKKLTIDTNQNQQKTNHFHKSRSKVIIGPYTNAKELKEIQKKIIMYNDSGYNTNDAINKRISYVEDENSESENSHKKIEDSLQELSSIKKESPENEDY